MTDPGERKNEQSLFTEAETPATAWYHIHIPRIVDYLIVALFMFFGL